MLNYFSTKQKVLLLLMLVLIVFFVVLAISSNDMRYLFSGAGTFMWMILYLYTTWNRGHLTENVNDKIRVLGLSKQEVMAMTRSTKMEVTGEVEKGLTFFMGNKKLKSFDHQLDRMIIEKEHKIKNKKNQA